MKVIQCFWLEPSDVAETSLRRYSKNNCPSSWGYHNASVSVGRKHYPLGGYHGEYRNHDVDKTDPHWPTHCQCGYAFQASDEWQTGTTRLYRRVESGELYLLSQAPVGAMWDADWYRDIEGYVKGHPEILTVKTPGGDWVVDGPSNSGGNWTRTGTVPNVTANPSIVCGGYHGFLRSGRLEEC
jgi:hypothetical protein